MMQIFLIFQDFDNQMGTGRINAEAALRSLQAPNQLLQWNITGGQVVNTTNQQRRIFLGFPGLADAAYLVRRSEIRTNVTFPTAMCQLVGAWGRGVGTTGYREERGRSFGEGICEVVPGTLTNTGATLRTWIYEVWSVNGQYIGFYPRNAQNVIFQYTVLGVPAPTTINGDNIVCSTSNNYSIGNLPVGATVQWVATPSGIVTINSPNSPQTTVTKNSNSTLTLSAIITSACGGQITVTKENIVVGYPMFNYTIISYYDCYQINALYNFSIEPGPNDYQYVTAYEWGYRPYNSLNETIVGDPNMPNTTVTIIFPTTGAYEVFVRPKNACGTGVESSYFVDVVYWCGPKGGGMLMLSASPNPSSSDIKVSLFEKDKPNIKKSIVQIKIIDKMGITKRQYNYGKGVQDPIVNIAGLAPDVYTILAFDGKQWTAAKFIKN
jgi:hypothetical protein